MTDNNHFTVCDTQRDPTSFSIMIFFVFFIFLFLMFINCSQSSKIQNKIIEIKNKSLFDLEDWRDTGHCIYSFDLELQMFCVLSRSRICLALKMFVSRLTVCTCFPSIFLLTGVELVGTNGLSQEECRSPRRRRNGSLDGCSGWTRTLTSITSQRERIFHLNNNNPVSLSPNTWRPTPTWISRVRPSISVTSSNWTVLGTVPVSWTGN